MSSFGFADWQVVDGVCLSACLLQGPCVDWEDLSRQESTDVHLGLSKLAVLGRANDILRIAEVV